MAVDRHIFRPRPKKYGRVRPTLDLLKEYSQVIIALFTVMLALVSIYQGWEIRSSKKDTQKLLRTFEKQADALQRSADAASSMAAAANLQAKASEQSAESSKLALDQNQNILHLEQRAWVGFSAIHSEPSGLFGPHTDVVVTISNSGRTPAKDISTKLECTNSEAVVLHQSPAVIATGILMPNDSQRLRVTLDRLSSEVSARIVSGETRIQCRGSCRYTDAFSQVHTTTFHAEWDNKLYQMNMLPSGAMAN